MATPVHADVFMDAAANPAFMRDIHLVSLGGSRIDRANTDDGQNTGMSFSQFGVASNIWNNEKNQVLAGVQGGRLELDRQIFLPGGLVMPERVDNASIGLIYKHITQGDWSLSQGVRYTQNRTAKTSITVKDTVDVVGLAAISREPGVAWAFGYIYEETGSLDPLLLPIVEYVNQAHDTWSITAGFPVLSAAYSPHPDLTLGGSPLGGAAVSYKVTQLNVVSLSFTSDNWAYRFKDSEGKGVVYSGLRTDLGWTYVYLIDHHTAVVVNASFGWEFNRKIGTKDDKLSLGDAAVTGLSASISF